MPSLAVICAAAAFFIKDYLANPLLVIFVYPILLFFSILVQYFFNQLELYSPKKLDQWLMWTIMASICGTFIGTAIGCLHRGASRPLGQLREPERAPAGARHARSLAAGLCKPKLRLALHSSPARLGHLAVAN